jgi:predicted methyltransferase MtxX (methanogen marker protein 4)
MHPAERGVAVLDRGGVGALGCEAVLDRHHHDAELVGEPYRVGVLHLDAADGEAAAVDVEDARDRAGTADRRVDAHGHVGGVDRLRA